ncbi:MAG: aminotransferase class V-fold PLP-dependent enzyme [Gammaproteobacteria bacterium]|nr:aminotransferase class V-fold PLP-dependent enzyme [Gammaproteobacteria bacterium]MDE0258247.1 aminotransferase class V-fold PLP-dependent enzyme [Gammaproteobacteria bacterium]
MASEESLPGFRPQAIPRRSFLRRSAGALALAPVVPVGQLALLGGRDGAGAEHTTGPAAEAALRPTGQTAPQEAWVARARAEIPASTGSLYFQTGGIGPSPEAVIDHVQERLAFQNESPAEPRIATDMGRIEPDLRAQLGRVFGAGTDEVALTHSTSEGISIVAWSLNWMPGDEVVISNTEHPANVIPWYVLRDRFGIVIREIDLSTGTGLLDEVRGQLSDRTRMVSVSHVSRNNGRTLRTDESAELGALLRSRAVRYHLDGAQGPGCVPTDFRALGCDCYSTCGHKWLLGPKGTGALFVRREVLDDVQLSWAGSHSHATMDYEGAYTLLPSAARYEFGTRALADFAGFARAVEWMEDVGLARVEERIQSLVDHAIEAVDGTDGLGVSSPRTRPDRSGVFVIELPEGCDATQLYNELREDDGILASPVRQPRDFRLSIHFFNTRDEIDAAIAAIGARCG